MDDNICPNCQRELSPGEEYCQTCGEYVRDAESSTVDVFGETLVDLPKPQGSAPAQAFLTLLTGRFQGRRYPLRDTQVLGRAQCDIILRDPQVSRKHALIRLLEGQFVLMDLGSANRTFVNDRVVEQPVRLKHGDRIRLGETELLFEQD